MTIKEIERYFESPENLNGVIDKFLESFERIGHFEDCLKNSTIDNPHLVKEALNELAAIYSVLNVVARVAEAYRINKELYFYHIKKMECDKLSIKYTEKQLESDSRLKVEAYRRISSIFEGYRDSCDKMISVLQSSLKSIERERFHSD